MSRPLLVLTACLALSCAEPPPSAAPPNFLFIFIDDIGIGDLGSYGNQDVETPNLDRLAAEGIQFGQFYVAAPICSPSRVGITTGQFPSRHLIHSYLNNRKRNRERGMRDFLDPAAPAIARTFQQAGYATGHFGKWHMGGGRDVGDAPHPSAYGFDESLVSFEGLGDRILPPGGLSEQSAALGQGEITRVEKHETTGIYVDRSIDFIRRSQGKPFYLHLWLNDVHDAYDPKPELFEKYARFSDNKYVQQYYAVMDNMDQQVGRLIATLDELGLSEDTWVVVAGDNGPTAWPRYYNEGLEPPGKTNGLRGRKWSLYEGGILEPFIVRRPGHAPAGGVNDDTVISGVDFFPTFTALAGLTPPEADFDGVDMSAAFLGGRPVREKPLIWEYGRDETFLKPGLEHDQSPNLAVRDGRWKLLINADGSRLELYDFDASHNEIDNVADQYPDVAKRMSEELLAWRRALPVLE